MASALSTSNAEMPTHLAAPGRRSATVQVLGIYAVVRLALLIADSLAAHIGYAGHLGGPLMSWDAGHYVNIAAHGYPSQLPRVNGHLTYTDAGFDPVFPLLIRIVAGTGASFTVAALIVSLLAGAAATVMLFKLAAMLYDEAVAVRSAIVFSVLPGMGVVWGIFYSECVGLAFAAGCLLFMARKQWVAAGVLGALASATNPMGLPLMVPALVLGIQAILRKEPPRAFITAALVPVGYLGFALWEGIRYHDILAWWHVQNQAWGATIDFGKSLILLLPHFWAGGYQGKAWLEWIDIVAVIAIAVCVWRARLPLWIWAYCFGVVALLFASNQGLKPRLLTWAFPAVMSLGISLGVRAWQAVVIAFALLTPIVFLAYTTLGNTMIQP
jgi:hypothetical protein